MSHNHPGGPFFVWTVAFCSSYTIMSAECGTCLIRPCCFWNSLCQYDHVCLSSEPNSYWKKAGIRVDGYQLGQDFTHLRQMMSESGLYRNAGLYGPDVGQPRDHRIDILDGWDITLTVSMESVELGLVPSSPLNWSYKHKNTLYLN